MNKTLRHNALGALTMTIGLSFAMAVALDDTAVGIGIGLAIGTVFFLIFNNRQKSNY